MAHMVPQYTDEAFWLVTDKNGESELHRKSDAGALPVTEWRPNGCTVRTAGRGWYYRLSAPGYMDCTDWSGPYASLTEAKRQVLRDHDVHPDTGDELGEFDNGVICGMSACSCYTAGECEEHLNDDKDPPD